MIDLNKVTKIHKNGTVALDKVTFHIDSGEFVFITGASGAGKSSIIKLLLGEEAPTYGDAVLGGYNVKKLTRRQIPKYRRQLGVVFQDFRLISSINVYDNVAFAMRAVGRPRREIKSRVEAVLEIVNLSSKKNSMPDQLSGGEQQRVALARAIVNAPKVILADEPTGNLDGRLSLEMMRMLDYINKSGITVVVVTHADNLVNILGKRVITLDHGRIVSDEPEVRRSEA